MREILCLTAATNALDTAADTGDDGQDGEYSSHNDNDPSPSGEFASGKLAVLVKGALVLGDACTATKMVVGLVMEVVDAVLDSLTDVFESFFDLSTS